MIECRKESCKADKDGFLHLHHLIPKFMGGTDKDGRKRLCEKHHNILHGMIPKIIFQYVPKEKREECKQAVKQFSERWLQK